MSDHHNIISIYHSLYRYSDQLAEKPNLSKDYVAGFDECLYHFMTRFKGLGDINYHLDNHLLRRKLNRADIALDDLYQDKQVLLKQVKELTLLLKKYQSNARVHKIHLEELRRINVEVLNQEITFFTNATEEQFDDHWPLAIQKVCEVSQKKQRQNPGMIKGLLMDFYKQQGFICRKN